MATLTKTTNNGIRNLMDIVKSLFEVDGKAKFFSAGLGLFLIFYKYMRQDHNKSINEPIS